MTLLDAAAEEDYYLTGLILFRSQPEFGGPTCIDLAHANEDHEFLSHHSVQRVLDQVSFCFCVNK